MGREQRLGDNVNVRLKALKNNVNVNVKKNRKLSKDREERLVGRIIAKLGPESTKDEAFWHKVVRALSEDQIETGLEIAGRKKPYGTERIRYIGGIYANMMRQ